MKWVWLLLMLGTSAAFAALVFRGESFPGAASSITAGSHELRDTFAGSDVSAPEDGRSPLSAYVAATSTTADAGAHGLSAQQASTQPEGRMAWWREARFGMFIHWGLYSLAGGEWEGRTSNGAGEWIMNDLQIPLSRYTNLLPQFNPVKFDAHQWVRIAKHAGMKYIIITSKHHEGFGMFRSALTDWCVKSTPFPHDPLKQLAEACRAEGLKLGFYYSIMDWHHPNYAPRKPWNDLAANPPDFDHYVSFMKDQLKELLTGYGPIGVLWFDGQWENTWTYERGAEIYDYVRGLQRDIIVNNRVSTELPLQAGQRPFGDYKTPEQSIPASGLGPAVDWETCMTMNNTWGYRKKDNDWKSAQTLVRNLIDCASKGGNYLLNVGPTGEGLIPEESISRLNEIGKWIKVNGEAIYGTSASPFPRQLSWGRCTKKVNGTTTTLYLHLFDWPADGQLAVPGLQNMKNKVAGAYLLADPLTPLASKTDEAGSAIFLPRTAPKEFSSTVVLQFEGAPDIQPVTITQKPDGTILLPASEARLHGLTFQYESAGQLDNIGYWTTPDDWADWEFKLTRPGKFSLSATIAATATGDFEISLGDQILRCSAPNTGNYVTFASVKLGTVTLPTIGKAVLAVRPIKDGWQPMNLKAIRLERIGGTN